MSEIEDLRERDQDLFEALPEDMILIDVKDERQTSVSMKYEVHLKFDNELYRVLNRADGYHVYHLMPDEEISVGIDNAEDTAQIIVQDSTNRDSNGGDDACDNL